MSLLTLGVTDLARARAFYAALGWHGVETRGTVFLQAGGVVVVLWSRDLLAADSGMQSLEGAGSVVLAHNTRTRAEVDAALAEAVDAGGTVTVAARETFYGGYAGCFADPDGHLWEVAHNPGLGLTAGGAVVLPDELLP